MENGPAFPDTGMWIGNPPFHPKNPRGCLIPHSTDSYGGVLQVVLERVSLWVELNRRVGHENLGRRQSREGEARESRIRSESRGGEDPSRAEEVEAEARAERREKYLESLSEEDREDVLAREGNRERKREDVLERERERERNDQKNIQEKIEDEWEQRKPRPGKKRTRKVPQKLKGWPRKILDMIKEPEEPEEVEEVFPLGKKGLIV